MGGSEWHQLNHMYRLYCGDPDGRLRVVNYILGGAGWICGWTWPWRQGSWHCDQRWKHSSSKPRRTRSHWLQPTHSTMNWLTSFSFCLGQLLHSTPSWLMTQNHSKCYWAHAVPSHHHKVRTFYRKFWKFSVSFEGAEKSWILLLKGCWNYCISDCIIFCWQTLSHSWHGDLFLIPYSQVHVHRHELVLALVHEYI